MIPILLKKERENAIVPIFGSEGAACFDFYAAHIDKIGDDKYTIFLGWSCEIPVGYKMEIVPRSSNSHTGWFMGNSPAQIDWDFRGELRIKLEAKPIGVKDHYLGATYSLIYPQLPYKVGDRVAQGFIEKIEPVELKVVETLSETKRGTGGFGHTGK